MLLTIREPELLIVKNSIAFLKYEKINTKENARLKRKLVVTLLPMIFMQKIPLRACVRCNQTFYLCCQ